MARAAPTHSHWTAAAPRAVRYISSGPASPILARDVDVMDDTKEQPGRILHNPQIAALAKTARAELLQPLNLLFEIVGVDIQVQPARSLAEPLHRELEVLSRQINSVVLRDGRFRPVATDHALPEGEFLVMVAGSHIDEHLADPAVMSHTYEIALMPASNQQHGVFLGKGHVSQAGQLERPFDEAGMTQFGGKVGSLALGWGSVDRSAVRQDLGRVLRHVRRR